MNIKIVICFIIIGFIPLASASDALWTAKSSSFIGANESLVFENYLVKAEVQDDATSLISVYKNNGLLEKAYFGLNESGDYDNISVTLLGIKGERSWVSIDKPELKEFWRFLNRTQLKWGESYAIENYSFAIDTYGRDSVNLTISNRSGSEKEEFFAGGVKDFETFRLSVTNINRTGFIDIDFFTNRLPEYKTEVFPFVKVELTTDKDEYFPDEPVPVSIKVSTDFNLNLMGMTLESKDAEIIPDNFSMTDISGERTFQSIMTGQPQNTTVSIIANLDIRDYSGNSYVLKLSKDISITPEVAIIKRVRTDTDDENVPVQLYVYNSGSINRTIHIQDAIPDEFNARSLEWDVEIGPGNSTTLEYNVTPERPGLYFLPPAAARWDGGEDISKRVKMTMHMPYIIITKSVEYSEGNTLVKLAATNAGDRPAQVSIIDNVLPGHPVVSGDTSWSGKLDGGEKTVINYYLQGDAENLPAAQTSYLDIRGVTRYAKSNAIESGISVAATPSEKNESAKPLNVVPTDLVLFMVMSFIAIAGIFTAAAFAGYLITRTLR